MAGSPYNGYDWVQRTAILTAYKRGDAGAGFTFDGKPCGLCGDPNRPAGEWHSEDYSQPFVFLPPATYPLCKRCHGRVHKRFNRPQEEWRLFCLHLDAGGYGREFTKLYPPKPREALMASMSAGEDVVLRPIRTVAIESRWWRELTLDPDALVAAWARPRPWRPRPHQEDYREALGALELSDREEQLLRAHAAAPRRSITMRKLAQVVLGMDAPSAANLIYGRLAHRLCDALRWIPDQRPDRSPIWMSVIAEGWQPPRDGQRREYEWVMVPVLASLWRELS